MPVVFRYKGYRFFFYSNEGNPREPLHIHVRKGEAVAKLSGDSWALFLNQQCEQPPFSTTQLELLATAAYRGQVIEGQQHLLQASVQWVEQHQQPNPETKGHA